MGDGFAVESAPATQVLKANRYLKTTLWAQHKPCQEEWIRKRAGQHAQQILPALLSISQQPQPGCVPKPPSTLKEA